MKKIIITIVVLTLMLAVFGSCAKEESEEQPAQEEAATTQEMPYEFEFADVNGDTHKLSDYKGKPVYLEMWASWCGYCKSSLPYIDKLAQEEEDFYVLSVVFPGDSGEKTKENFIEWYDELGYKNLTVMLDEQGQLLNDFTISGFPTSIFFDADGIYAGGRVGVMSEEMIVEKMKEIAEKEN